MRKSTRLLLGCLVIGTCSRGIEQISAASPQLSPPAVMESKWSGTIQQKTHSTWEFGSSESLIVLRFQNALPTLYRDSDTTDLNFTDDKGTGTVMSRGQVTLAGKTFPSQCSGSGASELHELVVDEIGKIYSIDAISPPCKGTDAEGNPTEEVSSITVNDQHLVDPNELAGSFTDETDVSGIHNVRTVSWSLTKGNAAKVELIVTPENYDNWMPQPGRDESSKGNILNVALRLQALGGGQPSVKAESFELTLAKTSREPGLTLNQPLVPRSNQLPDLRFIPHPAADSTGADQSTTVPTGDGKTGKAILASYDGGGYTVLTAVAILENHQRITGNLLVSGGPREIQIPKSVPGSVIALSWLNANGNPKDSDDREISPGNSNDGDGLSAYEEYRGVISYGAFRRLDPKEKEYGIVVSKSELPVFDEGIQWFEVASGIKVIKFDDPEIRRPLRRFNANSATSHVFDQYVVPLQKAVLPPGGLAKTFTSSNEPEIPRDTVRIDVDDNNISQIYRSIQQNAQVPVPFTLSELIAATVAHELAHGVDVPHHGDLPDQKSDMVTSFDTNTRIFDWNGVEITQRPFAITGLIGLTGSGESGNMSCIMAYNPYYNWALTTGTGAARYYSKVPLMVLGRRMCNSRVGTGINTPSANPLTDPNRYFGKAVNGNCLSLIRLK